MSMWTGSVWIMIELCSKLLWTMVMSVWLPQKAWNLLT